METWKQGKLEYSGNAGKLRKKRLSVLTLLRRLLIEMLGWHKHMEARQSHVSGRPAKGLQLSQGVEIDLTFKQPSSNQGQSVPKCKT